MSSIADALLRFLGEKPGLSYCKACLAKTTGMIVPEVLRACAELLRDGRTRVDQGPCATCRQAQTVIRAIPSGVIGPHHRTGNN